MSHEKNCSCMYCAGRRLGRQMEKKPIPKSPSGATLGKVDP